jgi:hypothetical protein
VSFSDPWGLNSLNQRKIWYLTVIDFKDKCTVTYDSQESKVTRNSTTLVRQETHSTLSLTLTLSIHNKQTLMLWLKTRPWHEQLHETPFPAEDWKHMNSFPCMGQTPQQGTPNDAGVDCGFFTLAFAMKISLGRTPFGFGHIDIPTIRH